MADALSRKTVQMLRALNAHFSLSDNGIVVAELIARPKMLNRVLEAQKRVSKSKGGASSSFGIIAAY